MNRNEKETAIKIICSKDLDWYEKASIIDALFRDKTTEGKFLSDAFYSVAEILDD